LIYKAVREKLDEVFREKRRKLVRFAFFKSGRAAMARFLLDHGADVNVNAMGDSGKALLNAAKKQPRLRQ
jgi:hypothetical protein